MYPKDFAQQRFVAQHARASGVRNSESVGRHIRIEGRKPLDIS